MPPKLLFSVKIVLFLYSKKYLGSLFRSKPSVGFRAKLSLDKSTALDLASQAKLSFN